MRRITVALVAAMTLVAHVALSAQKGVGHGNEMKHAALTPDAGPEKRTNIDVHIAWGTHDVEVIRTHYAPQYSGRRLPPGLAKKYARTGQLPPGWQKKMEPFPVVVERQLSPLPRGHHRGVIDGVAVIYNSGGLIVDVARLF
jgi:hypothetical protein